MAIFAWLALAAQPLLCQSGIGVNPQLAGDAVSGIFGYFGYTGTTVTGGTLSGSAPVKFKLLRVNPPYLTVSPSSGTTPTTVIIGVNPSVAASIFAGYKGQASATFTTTDQTPAVTTTVVFNLSVREEPPVIRAVLNSGSWQPLVAPGAMVSILGTALGPPVAPTFGSDGLYPKVVGANTTVTFNGIPASLLYSSPTQINALVPYALAGQKSAQVVVSRFNQSSDPFTVPLADTSPAVFTAAATGTGQGAILNWDYSTNSVDSPATKGLGVYIYATGMGVPNPLVEDGTVNLAYLPVIKTPPVSVMIGGKDAPVYLVGLTQFQPYGLVQVVVTVPTGIGSGPQPLVLRVGDRDNSSQNVTIAVK